MAYKNLKNTYLFYLPHEIQDEIEKIRIKSIKRYFCRDRKRIIK